MTAHLAPLHRVVDGGREPAGRVVLVHGFTQTLAAGGPVRERLAGRWEVVRVDLPGHGGSGGVRVGFAEAAGLGGVAGGPGGPAPGRGGRGGAGWGPPRGRGGGGRPAGPGCTAGTRSGGGCACGWRSTGPTW